MFNVPVTVKKKKKVSNCPSSSKQWRCLYDLTVCKPSNFPKHLVKITQLLPQRSRSRKIYVCSGKSIKQKGRVGNSFLLQKQFKASLTSSHQKFRRNFSQGEINHRVGKKTESCYRKVEAFLSALETKTKMCGSNSITKRALLNLAANGSQRECCGITN